MTKTEDRWIYPGSSFSAAERVPATGKSAPDRSIETIERVAATLALYDEIHVANERHDSIMAHYELVAACGAASTGRPMLAGRVLGPTGSGKTTAARFYRTTVEARGRHGPRERPVLIVPLDRACTSRRLFASILHALGDEHSAKGTEEVLQRRAYKALKEFGVRLLVIDETQHLAFRSTEYNDTTDTLKRFLDDGVAPLVLIGTDEATKFLNRNKQLANRLHPPCDLPRLERGNPADRQIFKRYVAGIDRALVDKGLVRGSSDLAEKRRLSALMEVSDGVLGRVSNLIRVALANAIARDADHIELCDLIAATSSWAVAQELVAYDPFVRGVRKLRNPRTADGKA